MTDYASPQLSNSRCSVRPEPSRTYRKAAYEALGGPLLDDFPGLGLKAYLIRERDAYGSPVNQYAPFYLWADTGSMGRFLWGGGGFGAIVSSFGRPAVRHWTGVACRGGDGALQVARMATREIWPIAPDVDPKGAVDAALGALADRAGQPGVCIAALAVDPQRWELVRFTLWDREPPRDAGIRYEILHLSTPFLDEITSSR